MKRLLILLMALLLAALPGLAEETDRQTEANAAYASVLLNGEAWTPSGDVREDWNPVRFTVLDLDGDGVSEVILEVTEPEAFIILTGIKSVIATEWPYRGLLNLKDDGTFTFSSGAMDNGVAMLVYQGDFGAQWGYLPLAESVSDADGAVTYWLDGGAEQTDEAGYLAFLAQQDAKLDALWYDYTEENVRMLLGQ